MRRRTLPRDPRDVNSDGGAGANGGEEHSRLPCYVYDILMLTNKDQKYKSVELGDQLMRHRRHMRFGPK